MAPSSKPLLVFSSRPFFFLSFLADICSQAFIFDGDEISIANPPDSFDFDLFYTNTTSPTSLKRLENPAMSIFRSPKFRPKAPKAAKTAKAPVAGKAVSQASTKSSNSTPTAAVSQEKDHVTETLDDAITQLQNRYAQVEADKLENAYGSLLTDLTWHVKLTLHP